jgi:UDPglucose 6-dehydrogenase
VKRGLENVVIGIDGLGYMGLATALGFAAKGLRVVGYDIKSGIRRALEAGQSPFHEKGFSESLKRETGSGRLKIVDSVQELAREASGVFLCLPTPSAKGGRIDLRAVRAGTILLGRALRSATGYRVVVVKSTVVPGTTAEVIEPLIRRISGKNVSSLGVAVSPEFISEGSALQDVTQPERIVLGTSDRKVGHWLRRVYEPFASPIFEMGPAEAELVKYASNAFLATKVAFANEISRITEVLGGDIDKVMRAVGRDSRIGEEFLRAGPGFGGSCFGKDLRALIRRSDDLGVNIRLARAALKANEEQAEHVVELVQSTVGTLAGKRIAFLGVSFKAGTDDVRESRAIPIIENLQRKGALLRIHDPVALENFRHAWKDSHSNISTSVRLTSSLPVALDGAVLAILHSDWPVYLNWKRAWSDRMKRPILLDLRRNFVKDKIAKAGLHVVALGTGSTGVRFPNTP